MDLSWARQDVCAEDIADYVSMGEGPRKQASSRIGRAGVLIVEATFDAAAQLAALRHAIATAIASSTTVRQANAAVRAAVAKFEDDDAIGNALFVPMVMGDRKSVV